MSRRQISVHYDPFDEDGQSMDVGQQQAQYQLAGDRPYYVWNGRKYPRVTKILDTAPGSHLINYAAKVAALCAAAPLIHSGLWTPPAKPEMAGRTPEYDAMDSMDHDEFFLEDMPSHEEANFAEIMAELEKYVDAEAMRTLTPEEAIARACNVFDNMKAPNRYRDHKGRIGSLAHYFKHEFSIGLRTEEPTIEYLTALAWSRNVVPEDVLERYASYGKDKESVLLDLAHHALPHCLNVWQFVQAFRPEYEMVGLEAVVVNTDEEYAGSLDDWAIYRQDVWREASDGKWPFDPAKKTVRLIGDLKTSNQLAKSVKFQLASYARASFVGLMADQTERALPEFDGMIAMHSRPVDGMKVVPWDQAAIDPCYAAFCNLNGYFRALTSLPRSKRGRQAKPAKKGERDCPIMVGGGF